jgi:hypothetical protein
MIPPAQTKYTNLLLCGLHFWTMQSSRRLEQVMKHRGETDGAVLVDVCRRACSDTPASQSVFYRPNFSSLQ